MNMVIVARAPSPYSLFADQEVGFLSRLNCMPNYALCADQRLHHGHQPTYG